MAVMRFHPLHIHMPVLARQVIQPAQRHQLRLEHIRLLRLQLFFQVVLQRITTLLTLQVPSQFHIRLAQLMSCRLARAATRQFLFQILLYVVGRQKPVLRKLIS